METLDIADHDLLFFDDSKHLLFLSAELICGMALHNFPFKDLPNLLIGQLNIFNHTLKRSIFLNHQPLQLIDRNILPLILQYHHLQVFPLELQFLGLALQKRVLSLMDTIHQFRVPPVYSSASIILQRVRTICAHQPAVPGRWLFKVRQYYVRRLVINVCVSVPFLEIIFCLSTLRFMSRTLSKFLLLPIELLLDDRSFRLLTTFSHICLTQILSRSIRLLALFKAISFMLFSSISFWTEKEQPLSTVCSSENAWDISSSILNSNLIYLKINRQIIGVLLQLMSKNKCENIPSQLIMKHSHKYLMRKTLLNSKFQWLNKYLDQDYSKYNISDALKIKPKVRVELFANRNKSKIQNRESVCQCVTVFHAKTRKPSLRQGYRLYIRQTRKRIKSSGSEFNQDVKAQEIPYKQSSLKFHTHNSSKLFWDSQNLTRTRTKTFSFINKTKTPKIDQVNKNRKLKNDWAIAISPWLNTQEDYNDFKENVRIFD